MNVNIKGVWLCCKAVLPQMIKQGKGKIINVSSNTALYGSPFMLHYVASKGAVIAITRALCKEVSLLAPEGAITVNAIAPGATFSEAIVDIEQTMGEGALDPYLMMQTIKHRITPEEMSGAMLFLCSNASDYMSGHLLVNDAGVSLY
jgi:3-oxoacyl-[acyl-carrier protein] reductase